MNTPLLRLRIDPKSLDRDARPVLLGGTAGDIPGWDSLAHVRIVMNIELRLSRSIEISDTYKAGNVGELIDIVRPA